jgi:4,5-DOPA dioxygenase extradiol
MNRDKTTLFLSHGGGPLPLLGDPKHQEMIDILKNISNNHIRKPSAILVISAHWEEAIPTITSKPDPELIYDYYGFPEESYQIKYPAIGAPHLAAIVHDCLKEAGIDAKEDPNRGFDHGLYVPLKLMYPLADIPCIQLSLINTLDPRTHIKIGNALENLKFPNLLIVGSGFSFHNLTAFFKNHSIESKNKNREFDSWLVKVLTEQNIDETTRENMLINWSDAPFARYCHPREEHLIPLHVCYGINHSPSTEHFSLEIMDKIASMFIWS